MCGIIPHWMGPACNADWHARKPKPGKVETPADSVRRNCCHATFRYAPSRRPFDGVLEALTSTARSRSAADTLPAAATLSVMASPAALPALAADLSALLRRLRAL
jgi:hypothetical protein